MEALKKDVVSLNMILAEHQLTGGSFLESINKTVLIVENTNLKKLADTVEQVIRLSSHRLQGGIQVYPGKFLDQDGYFATFLKVD